MFIRHRGWSGKVGSVGGNFSTKANDGFGGFGLPFAAAKPGRGGLIPLKSLGGIAHNFEMTAQFEGNHRVLGLFKEKCELARGIPATASAANASRDLFPVGHVVNAL